MATAAVSNPSLAVQSFARYRPTIELCQEWDGFVEEVDRERGTFWARLVRTDEEAPDEEAQFELHEFRPDERDGIERDTVFSWRTGVVFQAGELVRHSTVRLKTVRALSEDDHLEGKRLAAWVAASPQPGLDVAP